MSAINCELAIPEPEQVAGMAGRVFRPLAGLFFGPVCGCRAWPERVRGTPRNPNRGPGFPQAPQLGPPLTRLGRGGPSVDLWKDPLTCRGDHHQWWKTPYPRNSSSKREDAFLRANRCAGRECSAWPAARPNGKTVKGQVDGALEGRRGRPVDGNRVLFLGLPTARHVFSTRHASASETTSVSSRGRGSNIRAGT